MIGSTKRAMRRGRARWAAVMASLVAVALVTAMALPANAAHPNNAAAPPQVIKTLAQLLTLIPADERPGAPPGTTSKVPGDDPSNNVTVADQAQPSECWVGNPNNLGNKPLPIGPNGTCPNGSVPRTTGDYIGGITPDSQNKNIWYGTATSILCGGLASYQAPIVAAGLEPTLDYTQTDNVNCELNQSYDSIHNIPPSFGTFGDLRPGQILEYNIASGKVTDRAPTPAQDPDFTKVSYWRAAGAFGNIVFVGGLEGQANGGSQGAGVIDVEAYRASDGKWLAHQEFPQYANIKNFYSDGKNLYVGMQLAKPGPPNNQTLGQVLRWTGSVSNPFQFQTVGNIPNLPAYFTEFEGRIVISTWVGAANAGPPGLYISPRLHGPSGLTAADANNWTRVFNAGQLYPDPITVHNQYSLGLQAFDGWVYFDFSTVGVGASMLQHLATYPQINKSLLINLGADYLRSEPAGAVLRIKNLGKRNQVVQLLYGDKKYWTFNPNAGADGEWQLVPNLLHQTPRYGGAGFNNRWNDYVGWGISVFRGKLYMGTFNLEQVAADFFLNPQSGFLPQLISKPVPDAVLKAAKALLFPHPRDAATVWVFPNAHSPGHALTTTGFNNQLSFGVRGIKPIGNKFLFFSTNGYAMYPTTAQTNPLRRAGWQLLKMTP